MATKPPTTHHFADEHGHILDVKISFGFWKVLDGLLATSFDRYEYVTVSPSGEGYGSVTRSAMNVIMMDNKNNA